MPVFLNYFKNLAPQLEVAADPNAILIIARSGPEYGIRRRHWEQSDEEIKKIKEMESELYEYAKRCLERRRGDNTSVQGNRLFLGIELKDASPYWGEDYPVGVKKLKEELIKRRMVLGTNPVVFAYGGYTTYCARNTFQDFCKGLKRALSFKSRVIESL